MKIKKKINLIVIETSISNFSEEFEKYLINLNKKVLIISDKKIQFNNNFLYREDLIDKFRLFTLTMIFNTAQSLY